MPSRLKGGIGHLLENPDALRAEVDDVVCGMTRFMKRHAQATERRRRASVREPRRAAR